MSQVLRETKFPLTTQEQYTISIHWSQPKTAVKKEGEYLYHGDLSLIRIIYRDISLYTFYSL